MFDFFLFPMVFGMGTQNCTSKFHNLSFWTPILKCDTFMSFELNYLMFCIEIFPFREVQNFDPFSCSIFSYFQWFSEWEPKTSLLDIIT